ncbi:rRNA-processing protein utp21 [Dimargaris xerosporica]|nr:rRNA-processing protein utp21 [Dimargaris xerosporica]
MVGVKVATAGEPSLSKRPRMQDAEAKAAGTSTVPRLYQPFCVIGHVTNDVPFTLFTMNDRYVLKTCIGHSFQVYDLTRMGVLACSTPVEKPITSMACVDRLTYVTAGSQIIRFVTSKETGRTELTAREHSQREQEHKYAQQVHQTSPNHDLFGLQVFGDHLLALSHDNRLKIWNRHTLEHYTDLEFNHTTFQATCLVHPSTYLNKIVVGSLQGTLQLWNIKSRKLVYEVASLGAPVTCLVQSPVIDVLAIGLADGTIVLHNMRLDKRIVAYKQDGRVTSITFRTDNVGHLMATASMTGDIVLWDLNKRRLFHMLEGAHSGVVGSVQFLHGEPLLISSGADNAVRQWIFDEGEEVPRLLKERSGHDQPPTNIRYYGSSMANILSCGADRTLRMFSVFKAARSYELSQGSLLSKAKGQHQRLFNFRLPQILQYAANQARASSEWGNVITCHQNLNIAHLWSTHTKALLSATLTPEAKSPVKAVALSHCGNFALTGQANGDVTLFAIQSGMLRRRFQHHQKAVTGIACDESGRIFLSSSLDGTVAIWDPKKPTPVHILELPAGVVSMHFHTDNGLVVLIDDDMTIHVYDVETHKLVRKFTGHTNRITDLTMSPDGRWLVSASLDSTVRTWDLPTGYMVDWFRVDKVVTSLSFSPVGDMLAMTHVGQNGISLWLNRTMYQPVPLRPIAQDAPNYIAMPLASDPTAQQPADAVDDLAQDLDAMDGISVVYQSPKQLTDQMVTLSTVPKSKWHTLLNLDVIKKRNKPTLPPEKPKNAPFFMQTLPGLTPKFTLESTADAVTETTDANAQSRELQLMHARPQTEFVRLLKQGANDASDHGFQPFMTYLKSLGPSAVDFELRSLSLENEFMEPKLFLQAVEALLATRRDFELLQAYLHVFFKIHSDIIINNPEAFESHLEKLSYAIGSEWQRMDELLRYSLCMVEFARTPRY